MKFKRMIAVLLLAASLLTVSSCKLIRKIEKPVETAGNVKDTAGIENTGNYDTDFSSTPVSEDNEETGLLTNEDAAYEFLLSSFTDEEKEHITLHKTGAMTAQSNGYEYYIIEAEKTSEESSSEESEKVEKITYYVSVNGTVSQELGEVNTTTLLAKDAFFKKHGETDEETGLKYKLEYSGLITNKGSYCFNFTVYVIKENGDEEYKTNYIVALDGKASAIQALK